MKIIPEQREPEESKIRTEARGESTEAFEWRRYKEH
jgi:hypothetical protein